MASTKKPSRSMKEANTTKRKKTLKTGRLVITTWYITTFKKVHIYRHPYIAVYIKPTTKSTK